MQARATWNEVGLYLRWKWWCGSLTLKSVAGTLFNVLFVGLFACCLLFCGGFGLHEDRHLTSLERMCSVSPSSAPSSWSWVSVLCVVCLAADVLVVVVVTIGGRGSYWLLKSAAHKVAFRGVPCQAILCRGEPGRVVREIVVVLSVDSG